MSTAASDLIRPAQQWFRLVLTAGAVLVVITVALVIRSGGARWSWVILFATAAAVVSASPLVVDHRPDGEVIAPEELVLLPALVLLGPTDFLVAAAVAAPLGEIAVRLVAPVPRMRRRSAKKQTFNASVSIVAGAVGAASQAVLVSVGIPVLVAAAVSGMLMWWASHLTVARMVALTATDPVVHSMRVQLEVGIPTVLLGVLVAAGLDVAVSGVGWQALAIVPLLVTALAVGSRFQARELFRRGHLSALLAATRDITDAVEPNEVEERILQQARSLLTARRARLEPSPDAVGPDEAATPLTAEGPWLVVSDRAAVYRRFDASDLDLLAGLAAVGSAALARARAVAAVRERDEFRALTVAALSHDLRSPLAKAVLAARLLADGSLDGPHRGEVLAAHRRSLEHMQRIIDDLLDLGRMEHGHDGASATADCLRVTQQVRDGLEERERVSVETEQAVPAAGVDPRVLARILENLIRNGLTHGPRGGTVTVRLGAASEHDVELRVIDEGSGVPTELREVLFDPYRSGRPGLGVGLGLHVAKRFTEHAGGSLALEESGEDGTCFVVRLPRAKSELADPVDEEASPDVT